MDGAEAVKTKKCSKDVRYVQLCLFSTQNMWSMIIKIR